jgi:ubiquinone/menaquinone biosynthesis C-methylase UbiE
MKNKSAIKIDVFNEKAAGWDAEVRRLNTAAAVAEAIRGCIKLSSEMTAMDFGCGTGLVAMHLQPQLGRIDAMDTSQEMLNMLRQKLDTHTISNIHAILVRPDDYQFPEQAYDLIFSSLTLHHVADYRKLLAHFYQALKSNGRLALADLLTEDGDFHDNNDTVEHFGFEETLLREAAQEAGFRDISFRIIYHIKKVVTAGTIKSFPLFLLTSGK